MNIETIFRGDRSLKPFLYDVYGSFADSLHKRVILVIVELLDTDTWTKDTKERTKEFYGVNDRFIQNLLFTIENDYNRLYLVEQYKHGYWYNGECYNNKNLEYRIDDTQ